MRIATHLLAIGQDLAHVYGVKVGFYCLSSAFDVVGDKLMRGEL